jgi:hypothetical protein
LLGPNCSRIVGRWYRAIFVDLTQVAVALAEVLPANAHVLDVGGGDGEPLNHLLALRGDLRVTTLDPAPVVGEWIQEHYSNRVVRLPATSLADYIIAGRPEPDALLIADVMHHIPADARIGFLRSVGSLLERAPSMRIIVKDVEPGYWRALLGYCSDRYVTGDSDVSLISRSEVARLVQETLGPLRRLDTRLFDTDRPNYAIAFFR